MKKSFSVVVLMLAMCASSIAAGDRGFSLIVAPARYSVLQVMFDVINQREAVLVSYQGEATTAEPLLHVWSGTGWNPIGLHDLRELSFVQKTPSRAILIGGDDLLPTSVQDALSWMPEIVIIRQLENSALLNEMGRVLQWNQSEWKWFSARYNLQLEDEAAAVRSASWYDQQGPILKENEQRYEAVPYITPAENIDSSSTTLPEMEPVERPSDLSEPAASPDQLTDGPEYKVDDTTEEDITDEDIKDLVETLESQNAEKSAETP